MATTSTVAVENVDGGRGGFARHTDEEMDWIEKRWICRLGSAKNIRKIPVPCLDGEMSKDAHMHLGCRQ